MIRRIIAAAAGLAIAAIGGLTLATPANAAVALDCRSVTTTVNRPDHGHGTVNGGYWANMTLTRVTTFCEIPGHLGGLSPAQKDFMAKSLVTDEVTPPTLSLYTVEVTETGTLTTIGGATLSPRQAKKLLPALPGTVVGHWVQWLGSKSGFLNYEGNFDGATKSGLDLTTDKDEWAENVWGGWARVSPILEYEWTYNTCKQQWVDASDNNDGTDADAGDITGLSNDEEPVVLLCPSPTPSPSVSPSPVPVPSPSGTLLPNPAPQAGGGLVETGPSLTVPIVGGFILIAGGAAIAVWAVRNRRRDGLNGI